MNSKEMVLLYDEGLGLFREFEFSVSEGNHTHKQIPHAHTISSAYIPIHSNRLYISDKYTSSDTKPTRIYTSKTINIQVPKSNVTLKHKLLKIGRKMSCLITSKNIHHDSKRLRTYILTNCEIVQIDYFLDDLDIKISGDEFVEIRV